MKESVNGLRNEERYFHLNAVYTLLAKSAARWIMRAISAKACVLIYYASSDNEHKYLNVTFRAAQGCGVSPEISWYTKSVLLHLYKLLEDQHAVVQKLHLEQILAVFLTEM
jgi:hypothetical protein